MKTKTSHDTYFHKRETKNMRTIIFKKIQVLLLKITVFILNRCT